jgi:hypothetical protein
MKIFVDTPEGGSLVEIEVSTLEDDRLNTLAASGSKEARDEVKKRTGMDPYKPVSEHTPEDVEYYMEWLKNNDSEKYNKIVGSDKDVE